MKLKLKLTSLPPIPITVTVQVWLFIFYPQADPHEHDAMSQSACLARINTWFIIIDLTLASVYPLLRWFYRDNELCLMPHLWQNAAICAILNCEPPSVVRGLVIPIWVLQWRRWAVTVSVMASWVLVTDYQFFLPPWLYRFALMATLGLWVVCLGSVALYCGLLCSPHTSYSGWQSAWCHLWCLPSIPLPGPCQSPLLALLQCMEVCQQFLLHDERNNHVCAILCNTLQSSVPLLGLPNFFN